MPGVCPGGGDVEASIWLVHYVRCDRSVPYTCTFTAISTTLTDQNLKLMKQDRMVICRVFHWNVAYWPTVLKCACLYFCSQEFLFCSFTFAVTWLWVLKILKFSVAKNTLFADVGRERKHANSFLSCYYTPLVFTSNILTFWSCL